MKLLLLFALLAGLATAAPCAAAADPRAALPAGPARPLVVGTVPIPPFVVHRPDGTWGGISMDLWAEVARRLGLAYEVRELAAPDLDDPAVMSGVDVFVSLNVTARREAELDLTHAFYSTGLAIAVAPHPAAGLGSTLRQIFTAKLVGLLAALFAVLAAVGVLMWLAERRHNEAQFGGGAARGIGAGLWWSAVTMTTVGYGDKSPVTVLGRVLGLVWMFAAILIVASFTASISAALTVNQLETGVSGPADLPRVTVGTVARSQGARYLQARGVPARAYADAGALVDGLAHGEVAAVVFEAPILQYEIKRRAATDLRVLDGTFDNHGYALALRPGSPLRKAINLALLQYVASDDWTALLGTYL